MYELVNTRITVTCPMIWALKLINNPLLAKVILSNYFEYSFQISYKLIKYYHCEIKNQVIIITVTLLTSEDVNIILACF